MDQVKSLEFVMKNQIQMKQVLEIIPEPIQTVKEQQDESYQNFTYCLINRNRKVSYRYQFPIDYTIAEGELSGLDWTCQDNGISIFSVKTNENIFCSRLKHDKWFVLTPVLENNIYTGLQWTSYPDTKSLLDTLRAFFNEEFWFGNLEWTKMRWKTGIDA